MSLNTFFSWRNAEVAKKDQLRKQRRGTVINAASRKQESDLFQAMMQVEKHVIGKFGSDLIIGHKKQWNHEDIVSELRKTYPQTDFHYHFDTSSIRPDGGVLCLGRQKNGFTYPILIAEVKNQGTNDIRAKEGLGR